MNCDQVRRQLSQEPVGAYLPRAPLLRRHLQSCAECRRFWHALSNVDQALALRPLARPCPAVIQAVMGAVERRPRQTEIAPPLSRAFWAFSAGLTLLALVAGAWLLHSASTSSPWTAGFLLEATWPNDASTWLSLQGDRMAEVILASLAGILVALLGAVLGFKASAHRTDETIAHQERIVPPR